MTTHDDPRLALDRATDLVGSLLEEVAIDDHSRPTPCSEYDVGTLAQHVIAVARRVGVVGAAGDPLSVPEVAEDVRLGEWSRAWKESVEVQRSIWSDDAVLDRELTLPFAVLPGAIAAAIYTAEFLVHAWDLSVSIGADPVWDERDVEAALVTARNGLPAEPRGTDAIPFDPVTETAPGDPSIERLVAWFGRKPQDWIR